MTSVKVLGALAVFACAAMVANAADLLPSAPQLDAVGKWPSTAIMGAVALGCAYLMYKQSLAAAKTQYDTAHEFMKGMMHLGDSLKDLVASQNELSKKVASIPCAGHIKA